MLFNNTKRKLVKETREIAEKIEMSGSLKRSHLIRRYFLRNKAACTRKETLSC